MLPPVMFTSSPWVSLLICKLSSSLTTSLTPSSTLPSTSALTSPSVGEAAVGEKMAADGFNLLFVVKENPGVEAAARCCSGDLGNQATVVTINEIPPLPPLCHGQGGFGRVSVFPTQCAQ